MSLFSELKRRNVYKVAVAYLVVGWLLVQIATQVFPFLEIPNWVVRLVIALVAIGCPIALIIAWAFEATPEGIKRTEVADAMPSVSREKKHTWIYIVVIGGLISAALFFVGRYTAGSKSTTASPDQLSSKSIAVLPFDNLSRDPDNAYFCEGMQDEILTRLARIADLKVISRTSTQHFKSAPENLPEIAKQLGVTNILEGSVQKVADRVRVNVQLINALTDAHLWADTYDRKLTDIFGVESEISTTIADMLQAKLTASEKTAIAKQPTANTEAYELYLKGASFLGKRSGDNIPKAIAFYEEALSHDPNYALAYAGLAQSYVVLPLYTPTRRSDAWPKAKEAAHKALELDPNLAEAHTALGNVLRFEIEYAASIPEYQRAIELKPNDAPTHHWYGNGPLIALGRVDEAIAEGKRSVELDPLSPIIRADFGNTLYFARRYDEAIAQYQKSVELDPNFFYSRYNLGLALQIKGDLAGAMTEYERAKELSDDPMVLAYWAAAKAYSGDRNAALQALTQLDEIAQHREVLSYARAILYLSLNDKEKTIDWLEKGVEERDGFNAGFIKVEPLMDSLRGNPRFEALVQKVVGKKQ
jgi:adenylate cyclase